MFVARRLRTLLIVVAVIANRGPASAQTDAGQKVASSAPAAPKTAAGKSSAVVPRFVPMPKDIQCELHGVSYMSVVGANGQMNNTSGSVDGVTCWILGKSPEQKKDIPIVSSTITDGILKTKDFGNLKLSPTNNISSAATGMAIRSDKVQLLRTFLAQASKQDGGNAVETESGKQHTLIVWSDVKGHSEVATRASSNALKMLIGTTRQNQRGYALLPSRDGESIKMSNGIESLSFTGLFNGDEPDDEFYWSLGVGATLELPNDWTKLFGVTCRGGSLTVTAKGIEFENTELKPAGSSDPAH